MGPLLDPGGPDPADLVPARPARLTTSEVCQLARLSRATLWRRVADGRLPRPVDHGRQALFCARAVTQALDRPLKAIPPADAIHAARFDRLVGRRDHSRLTLQKVQNKTLPNSEIISEIGSVEAGLGPLRRNT